MNKVSVFVPYLDNTSQINKSLYSIIHQNYQNFEIIILSNQTINIEKDNIKQIKVRKNISVQESINNNIDEAESDFICLLNPNDLLLFNAISLRIKEFERNPELVACYGFGFDTDMDFKIKLNNKSGYFFEDEELPTASLDNILSGKINLTVSSLMIKKEIFRKIKLNESLGIQYAWNLFIELFSMYPDKILQINEPVYMSRNQEVEILRKSRTYIKTYIIESLTCLDNYFSTSANKAIQEKKYCYYKNIFYTVLFIILEHFPQNYILYSYFLFLYIKKNSELNYKLTDLFIIYIGLNNLLKNTPCKLFPLNQKSLKIN